MPRFKSSSKDTIASWRKDSPIYIGAHSYASMCDYLVCFHLQIVDEFRLLQQASSSLGMFSVNGYPNNTSSSFPKLPTDYYPCTSLWKAFVFF